MVLFQLSKDSAFTTFTYSVSRMGHGAWTAHTVLSLERPRLATGTPWVYSSICPYLVVIIG